jgi:F420-non-reducing hydrogenase iron-sulfur subunit
MVQFEPRILACSATISPHHILKAFQKGADGVFVGG